MREDPNHIIVGDDPRAEWDRVIRARFVVDGAETLAEAAARLRACADELDALAAAGWRLVRPIQDHGYITRRPVRDESSPSDTQ